MISYALSPPSEFYILCGPKKKTIDDKKIILEFLGRNHGGITGFFKKNVEIAKEIKKLHKLFHIHNIEILTVLTTN